MHDAENTKLLKAIAQKLDRQNKLMERWLKTIEQQNSEWCEPDEACRVLGIRIVASNNHRRKLKDLKRRGKITKYREGNPNLYYRPELNKLSREKLEGKLVI